ncbi:MAG: hypothetical protein K1060chlam5_00654 [Candidatus Anoxychlamydiales bacterium]|nr:hypothetical protein [Candidatus Anoxychlamydiales bacterium]
MKVAVIPNSENIGDSFLLLTLCHQLKKKGYEVDVFHNKISTIQSLFSYNFKKYDDNLDFSLYDKIYIQHNNKEKTENIKKIRDRKSLQNIHFIYFTHKESKHGKLSNLDIKLDPNSTMLNGLCKELKSHFNLKKEEKEIGIKIPKNSKYKKHKKRVIIYSSSKSLYKKYPLKKFIKIAKKLKLRGYQVSFCVPIEERKKYLEVLQLGFDLPAMFLISDFAMYLHESSYFIGNDSFASHLASYLKIPSIVISSNIDKVKRWKPSWNESKIVTPPSYLFNFKYLPIKDKYWQMFVTTNKILKSFNQSLKAINII